MIEESKILIEKYINDIEDENFEDFFLTILAEDRVSPILFNDIVDTLNDAAIDTTGIRENLLIESFDNYIEEVDDWQSIDDVLDTSTMSSYFAINNFERRCKLIKEYIDKHRPNIQYSGYGTSEFQVMYLDEDIEWKY